MLERASATLTALFKSGRAADYLTKAVVGALCDAAQNFVVKNWLSSVISSLLVEMLAAGQQGSASSSGDGDDDDDRMAAAAVGPPDDIPPGGLAEDDEGAVAGGDDDATPSPGAGGVQALSGALLDMALQLMERCVNMHAANQAAVTAALTAYLQRGLPLSDYAQKLLVLGAKLKPVVCVTVEAPVDAPLWDPVRQGSATRAPTAGATPELLKLQEPKKKKVSALESYREAEKVGEGHWGHLQNVNKLGTKGISGRSGSPYRYCATSVS